MCEIPSYISKTNNFNLNNNLKQLKVYDSNDFAVADSIIGIVCRLTLW